MKRKKRYETLEDRILRFTKRELVRSHRAQPELVESLLLAHQFNSRNKASENILPMTFILNLTLFQQKMLWLLPWGPELIDESARAPTRGIPDEFKRIDPDEVRLLSKKELYSLVANKHHQWDRIWVYEASEYSFLEHVHLHPCEELYLESCRGIKRKYFQNLTRCHMLQSFMIDTDITPGAFSSTLRKIQSLEFLDVTGSFIDDHDLKRHLKLYQRLPNLVSLHIDFYDGVADFADVVKYIRKRKETLRHVKLGCCIDRSVAHALAECKNIISLQINDRNASYDDIEPLVTCKHFHKTVQQLNFSDLRNVHDFWFLELFTAIRWLALDRRDVTNEDLRSLVMQNSKHLVAMSIVHCHHITLKVLDTIERCTGLASVDLRGCRIKRRRLEAYQSEKRRNYEALCVGRRVHDTDEYFWESETEGSESDED